MTSISGAFPTSHVSRIYVGDERLVVFPVHAPCRRDSVRMRHRRTNEFESLYEIRSRLDFTPGSEIRDEDHTEVIGEFFFFFTARSIIIAIFFFRSLSHTLLLFHKQCVMYAREFFLRDKNNLSTKFDRSDSHLTFLV